MKRRDFVKTAALGAASYAMPGTMPRPKLTDDQELTPIWAQIEKRHDETVRRLQQWIRQPSIAAENRGMTEGCDLTMQMLREAGFAQVTKIPTAGQPGIFAVLDAGAPRTLGVYYMYDVKQVEPAEWSSPPFEAALVDKPGFGKVLVEIGRASCRERGRMWGWEGA